MFNSYKNIYLPEVVEEIDIYDFLDRVQNPTHEIKIKIDRARIFKMLGNEKEYQRIKHNLPCYTLNFEFTGKKSNDNISDSTGFIYLDIDNTQNINLSNPYIFAAWLSLSGAGFGLLVKVDGLTLENFKLNYEAIGRELGLNVDLNAAKATQYTIHSYDENIYINNDSTTWRATTVNTPTSLPYKKKKKRYGNETGVKETIRYDNLDELDFDGQDYLVFPDEKYEAAKAYVPQNIPSGKRNNTLFVIGNQFKALNPNISSNYLFKKMHGINTGCCNPPLSENEVNKIISNILELENQEPFSNYPRRVVFNPEVNLSPSDKRKITNKTTGAIRSNKTMKELCWAIFYWDYWVNGRVTQKKLAKETKKNIKTIERHYRKSKTLVSEIEDSN